MKTFTTFEEAYREIKAIADEGHEVHVTMSTDELGELEPVEQGKPGEAMIWLKTHETYRSLMGAEHVAVTLTVKKI